MKISKKRLYFLGIFVLLVVAYYVRYSKRYRTLEGQVFGTYYKIQYQSRKNLEKKLYPLFDEINSSLSTYSPNSIISKVNKNTPTPLDSHFKYVFNASNKYYKQTGGAFDITVAPLVDAWGFGSGEKRDISPALIDSLLRLVGMDKVSFEKEKVKKKYPAIQLDVSAIAKGYAVDVIADMLETYNSPNYLVEIGGELRIKGKNKQSRPWTIGIDRPSPDRSLQTRVLIDTLHISSGALATSGNYRQYYYKNGKKYSHTINPKTGYPVQHNLLSATVRAKTCMQADALATACMVLGVEKSINLQQKLQRVEIFLIYENTKGEMKTYVSEGLQNL